jgi:hypothetical protein
MLTAKKQVIKCDWCGRFISYSDLADGKAWNHMRTPDSPISSETFESKCERCIQKDKKNASEVINNDNP